MLDFQELFQINSNPTAVRLFKINFLMQYISIIRNGIQIWFKSSQIFGLLFICDWDTIAITPLLNISISGKNIPVVVLYIVACKGHISYGKNKNGTFICDIFIGNIINRIYQDQHRYCYVWYNFPFSNLSWSLEMTQPKIESHAWNWTYHVFIF